MADNEACLAYITAIEAEQERQGVKDLLLAQSGRMLPDEQLAQIARDGFGGLSDDELADFAFSPEALRRRSLGAGCGTRWGLGSNGTEIYGLAVKLIFYSCASVFDVTPLLMGRESHRSHNHSATSLGIFPL